MKRTLYQTNQAAFAMGVVDTGVTFRVGVDDPIGTVGMTKAAATAALLVDLRSKNTPRTGIHMEAGGGCMDGRCCYIYLFKGELYPIGSAA